MRPNLTREWVPELLKLSSDMNECKPLPGGVAVGAGAGSSLPVERENLCGRGLHSSTSQLNLSRV